MTRPAEHKQVLVRENPPVPVVKDWLTLALAFIGALKLLLAAPPFLLAFPAETWDAVANMVSVCFAGYGIYKNTYALSQTAKQQKDVLQQAGLKKD